MLLKDSKKHDDTIKNKIKTTKHYFDTCEQERIAHNRTMMIIHIVTNIVGVLAVGVFVFIFVFLFLIFSNIRKYHISYEKSNTPI